MVKVNNCGSGFTFSALKCSETYKPEIKTIKFNTETGEVFDDLDNYLGIGTIKENRIEVTDGKRKRIFINS